jgi:hypothetical protein
VSDAGLMMVDHPNSQQCVWFPLSKSFLALECNGFNKKHCKNANAKVFKRPETEEEWKDFENQKRELRKREKATKEKEQKKRKTESKTG